MGVGQSSDFESNLAMLLDAGAQIGSGASVSGVRAFGVDCGSLDVERWKQGMDVLNGWFLRFVHLGGHIFTNHVGPYPGLGSYVFPPGTNPPWTPA